MGIAVHVRTAMAGRVARWRAEECGAMLLEFAFAVWTILLLTFLIFEFCMSVYTYSVLSNAAREGVRYAVVHGSDNKACSGPSSGCDGSGASVIAVVNGYAKVSFHDLHGMKVNVTWPDGKCTPSSRVLVSINYPYVPYLELPAFVSPLMKVTAEGRIVF